MNLKKVSTVDYVEEEHGAVYNFFYTMGTHFLNLMSVNVLYCVFNIPMFFVAYAYSLYFLPLINHVFDPSNFTNFMIEAGIIGNEAINDIGTDAVYQLYYLVMVFCVMFLLGSGLMAFGPFQAGFSQIYRNLYRQEGVFVLPDFKEGLKKNWKQSLASMFVSLVVTAVALFAIGFYLNLGTTAGTVLGTFFTLFFFVFIIIQNMANQMIVSVDLPLHKIYRNAFLFFLLKFGPCVALLGIMVILLMVIPFLLIITTTYAAYGILVFYYLTFIIAIVQFMFAFFTGELIKSYIGKVEPTDAEDESEIDDDFDEDDSDEDDDDSDDSEEDNDDSEVSDEGANDN